MNRIAKIEARGNGLARLFDADGAQIGDLDAWVSYPVGPGDNFIAEIARRLAAVAAPSEPMFKVGDEGLTRGGLRYLVRLTDARGGYPILAEIEASDGTWHCGWRLANGCFASTGEDGNDLMPVRCVPRVSDATVEAARMAVEGNVPCPGKSWFRTAVEADIAHHEAEKEDRA